MRCGLEFSEVVSSERFEVSEPVPCSGGDPEQVPVVPVESNGVIVEPTFEERELEVNDLGSIDPSLLRKFADAPRQLDSD